MKVYDCFTFYNEFELLELRLKSLWNVVDYFVIVEANRKHNGESKIFNFWERQDEFKDFLPKIRFVPADLSNVPFNGVGDWSIEYAQRNAIMQGLIDAEPEDLILISDLDEIPAPDVLQRIYNEEPLVIVDHLLPRLNADEEKFLKCVALSKATDILAECPLVMAQKFFYYYFDWVSNATWQGTILTKRKNLTMPQELRNLRNLLPRVVDGGWHFSYMGGVERVINKMTSIVDGNELVEKSDENLIDRSHVEEAIAKGADVYNRHDVSDFLPYDARNICLPHLEEFLRKYPHFLREPEKFFGEDFNGADDLQRFGRRH